MVAKKTPGKKSAGKLKVKKDTLKDLAPKGKVKGGAGSGNACNVRRIGYTALCAG